MKVVIIGNGPAGTTAASTIRALDKTAEVLLISQDEYPYYIRPQLPEVISGHAKPEQLQIFKTEWYQNNNIELKLSALITDIDPKKKIVLLGSQIIHYDKLLLATGAEPNIPDIKGIKQKNIFTLRTMKDAIKIRDIVAKKKSIITIGGGLLGLECANSLVNESRLIKVIEYFDYLLPRQLSKEQADRLKQLLEHRGFEFHLSQVSDTVEKVGDTLVVTTKSGEKIDGDAILLSAGVHARTKLAKKAGLLTEKGIIVNNFLQTSHPDIYAAGDCIQFGDQLWGFVKSAAEQGKIAGENIVKENTVEYQSSKIDVVLKVTGIDINGL